MVNELEPIMVNLMCRLTRLRDARYLVKYYFWVCLRVSLEETSIQIGGLSKEDALASVGRHHPIR